MQLSPPDAGKGKGRWGPRAERGDGRLQSSFAGWREGAIAPSRKNLEHDQRFLVDALANHYAWSARSADNNGSAWSNWRNYNTRCGRINDARGWSHDNSGCDYDGCRSNHDGCWSHRHGLVVHGVHARCDHNGSWCRRNDHSALSWSDDNSSRCHDSGHHHSRGNNNWSRRAQYNSLSERARATQQHQREHKAQTVFGHALMIGSRVAKSKSE